jgi:hypothetical protein
MIDNYKAIVAIPNGYFLEKETGFLSVVIPEKRTNYILNPLLVQDLGSNVNILKNFAIAVATVTRINGGPFWTDYPRFTVTTNSSIGALTTISTKVGTYYASIWAKSIAPNTQFRIRIRGNNATTNAAVVLLSNVFTASTEDFQRYEYVFTTTGLYSVYVDVLIVSGTTIDIAGMQLEKGNYATSFIHGFAGEGYNWNGPPYDGSSTRQDTVLCGGREINLKDLGFRITSVEGLGIPDNFEINSQPKAFGLGSIFTCRSIDNREISVSGVVYACDLKSLLTQRNNIGYAVFDLNKMRCFKWQPYDCKNTMECVQFFGLFESGLSFGYNTHYGEEIELNFVSPDIGIRSCNNTCQTLDTGTVSNQNKIIAFEETGARADLPTPSLATFTLLSIIKMEYSTFTKKLYAACSFISGVTTRYAILEYDGEGWIPIIFSTAPIKTIYTYGNWLFAGTTGNSTFSGQNGWVNTGTGLVMFGDLSRKKVSGDTGSISTASVLNAAGATTTPSVNAFVSDGGDFVYFGGSFAASSGFEAKLGVFDIRASVSAQPERTQHGINGYATARGSINALLFIKEKNELWFGGDFNNNIATSVANVAQTFMGYNFQRATQVNKFGSGIYQYLQKIAGTSPPRPFGNVLALEYYQGRVFVGGDFDDSDTSSTLVPSPHRLQSFAYIDGDGILKPFPANWGFTDTGVVRSVIYDFSVCDNVLHIAGALDRYGNVNRTTGILMNATVAKGAADYVSKGLGENGYVKKAIISADSDLYNGVICTDNPDYSLVYYNSTNVLSSSQSYRPTTITLCNNRLETNPVIYVRGPGTITSVTNFSNNTKIFLEYKFSTFTISGSTTPYSDEIVSFDFTTNPVTVKSSTYGDLSKLIEPSSIPISLVPGENDIMIDFTQGSTTVDTKAWICWQDTALSAEALQTECL